MRICVYGAGAMGTSLGAFLTEGGTACELISRNAEHIAALRGRGARIVTKSEARTVPVKALLPEEISGKYDVVFLATKQRENRALLPLLSELLRPDGVLVTVQNGLPERELSEGLSNSVYGAVLSWGAERTEAGTVRVTSESGYRLALGAFNEGTRLEELRALFSGSAIEAEVGDLHEIRFAKLAVNASFSTLSAISGLTFGEIAARHRRDAAELLKEVFRVARAYGCKRLPLNGHDLFRVFKVPSLTLPIAMKKYRETRSGMLLDLMAGRRTDVDFVAGACVAAGKARGVETPLLLRGVEIVHEIENGLAEIAPESLYLLRTRI